MNTQIDTWVNCMNFLPTPLQHSWRPWLTLASETQYMCFVASQRLLPECLVASQRSAHRTMTNIFDYMTYNYILVQPRAQKLITFLSQYICHNRKLSIFNFRFN